MAKSLHYDPSRNKASTELLLLANKLAGIDKRSPSDAIRVVAIEAGTIKLKHPTEYHNFISKFQNSIPQSAS